MQSFSLVPNVGHVCLSEQEMPFPPLLALLILYFPAEKWINYLNLKTCDAEPVSLGSEANWLHWKWIFFEFSVSIRESKCEEQTSTT
ncbi:hypothetical protein CEXT_160241 [Caerostris extrusa]|uniref:Uncharacterized protein n=1 Tax=Caerostris extrusa TaxID=172846 RepID=A0AAV4MQ92_CAEEX|nr:hypothetical protein CEXT_160241 [Caerostris extrusa]